LISLAILANGGGKTEKLFTGNAARRLDCPAFRRALETGQTNRRNREPIRSRTQRAFLKPRSTAPSSVHFTPDQLRSASISETPAQCEHDNSSLINDASHHAVNAFAVPKVRFAIVEICSAI
jgi:hypothetical protein